MRNDVNFTWSHYAISFLVLKQCCLCCISSTLWFNTGIRCSSSHWNLFCLSSLYKMSHRYFLGNTFWAKSDWESQNRLVSTVYKLWKNSRRAVWCSPEQRLYCWRAAELCGQTAVCYCHWDKAGPGYVT